MSVPRPSTAHLGPYGKVLLTISREKVATLWDPQTGRAIGQPLKFADEDSAYFAPGGDFLVARDNAQQLLLIDTKTGAPVRNLTGIKSVEFSEKGRRAFVELRKPRGSLSRVVWNTRSGQLQDLGLPADEEVNFAHFTQDEEKLIVALRAPKSLKSLRVITWPRSGNANARAVIRR